MARRTMAEIPQDHRRCPPRFSGVSDDGVAFDLEIGNRRRRVGSGDLAKAHVMALSRGRPLSESDLYREETEIALFVEGRRRVDIRVNRNGTYSVGNRHSRSLREIVEFAVAAHAPRRGMWPGS